MIATLLGLAGYLLYIAFMVGLMIPVFGAAVSAFPTLDEKKYEPLLLCIAFALPFVVKDTLYLALISGFPSTLPSSASEMIVKQERFRFRLTQETNRPAVGFSFLPSSRKVERRRAVDHNRLVTTSQSCQQPTWPCKTGHVFLHDSPSLRARTSKPTRRPPTSDLEHLT